MKNELCSTVFVIIASALFFTLFAYVVAKGFYDRARRYHTRERIYQFKVPLLGKK